MKNYKNQFMAVCVKGLEFVAADEIKRKIQNANVTSARGRVFFHFDKNNIDLEENLKCVDNVYKLYRKFDIGNHKADLPLAGKQILDIDFEMQGKFPYKVIISAVRSGKHNYSRFDLAEQMKDMLVLTGKFVSGDPSDHDLAVRVEVTDNKCSIYKQLTKKQMRFRGDFDSVPGGIRPTAAHCMIRLSSPQTNEVFYDPFCGAGTIAYERSYYKSKKIFASDINADVLETAKKNLKQEAVVFLADAQNTRMKDHSVHTVVSNIPWGKQIQVTNISSLYQNFIKELKRILVQDGKAVLLTDKHEEMIYACNYNQMHINCIAELSLHGLHPNIYKIRNSLEE